MRRLRFVFWVAIWGAIGIAGVAAETAEHARAPIPAGASSPATATGPAATAGNGAMAPQSGLPVPADQVVTHISHSIDWYRGIIGLQQLPADPDDVVSRGRLNQSALTSLELAFDFGHAAAGLTAARPTSGASGGPGGAASATPPARSSSSTPASPTGAPAGSGATSAQGVTSAPGTAGTTAPAGAASTTDNSGGQAGEIDRAASRLADRLATLQSQLASVNEQIASAPAKDKATLIAQRDEISAALDLTRQIQATVAQIQRFEENSDVNAEGGGGGLAAQIAELQKTVPEVRQIGAHVGSSSAAGANAGTSSTGSSGGSGNSGSNSSNGPSPTLAAPPAGGAAPAAPAAPAPASTEAFRPESAGVITLIGRWFSLQGAKGQVADAIKRTDTLTKELDGLRATVTQEARSLARDNLDISTADVSQLAQAKQQYETASTRFKQLSRLLIPLGEQGITVENARNILDDWRDSIAGKNATVARYLLLRLGFLFGSIAVVLIISDIWRRATFRYLSDSRRRAQFLALRRVAVGIALTVVIAFGLVSEVGSLATYAGLITAGLAVALQNVILAVVAYFFLIGRYGVRVGDRITLAGVTGSVVEIGLVRIYLMELVGPELRSSGRMVVLSNAVLFQPTALFKQMPGGNYFWHTIVLTLAPSTDVTVAEKRFSEAAEAVYQKYRTAIEQQHAALQRFIDFETAMPRPEVYVRLTEKGLECTVRYPVEPARAASIDQMMLKALREAPANEPALELKGGPVLMSGDT